MSSTEPSVADDEIFVLQQNEVNEAISKSREALYTPSDVTECIDCGDEIPPARKLAVPSAIRCISCAEMLEKRRSK